MANLTLSIDDKLLQAARVRAVSEGTSVNEVCRKAIESYARAQTPEERSRRFQESLAWMQAAVRASNPIPAPWKNREEMYEQMFAEKSEPVQKE